MVDKALSALQQYLNQELQNWSDIQETGANQGVFFYNFDDPIDTWNFRSGSISRLAYPSNGTVGGKALEATGEVWASYGTNIPFNPYALYRVHARVRMTKARNMLFMPSIQARMASPVLTTPCRRAIRIATAQPNAAP